MKTTALLSVMWLALLPAAHAELPDPTRFSVVLETGDVEQAKAWLAEGLAPDFEGQLIGTGLMIGAWEGNIRLLELFYRHGANLEYTNRFGETALMLAAWRNQRAALQWLLAHGARPNRSEHEWTALHYAVFAGHETLVEDLLAAGADVNARSTNGSTVIMMAAREGHEALARRLLDAGADPTLKNDYGDDAVSWALRQQNPDIAKTLSSAAPNVMPLPQRATAAIAPAPPQHSQAAPEVVDELLRKARLAEMEGEHAKALKLYRRAWMELEMAEPPRRVRAETSVPASPAGTGTTKTKPPRSVVIRAKRSRPEQQSLSISY